MSGTLTAEFHDLPIRLNGDWIVERGTDWIPPKGDRFCEYGPEDEHWMRPLGLGSAHKRYIDMHSVSFTVSTETVDHDVLCSLTSASEAESTDHRPS